MEESSSQQYGYSCNYKSGMGAQQKTLALAKVIASDSALGRNVFEVLRRRAGYCGFLELIKILTSTRPGFIIAAEED